MSRIPDLVRAEVEKERERILKDLKQYIAINTVNPPGNEGVLADLIAADMKSAGAQVEYKQFMPGRPNLVCTLDFGRGRCVLLNAHMDTVPIGNADWTYDPFGGEEHDGRIYGRGACDDKGGLAAMAGAMRVLARLPLDLCGEVVYNPIAWEEGGGKGTQHFVQNGMIGKKPAAVVIGEPTSCDIALGHNGSARRLVVVRGKAAHSSDPKRGENAIYRAARFSLEIERLEQQLRHKKHPLIGSPTTSVNIISGGVKHNVVPDRVEMTLDRRLIPGETPELFDKEITTIIERLKLDDPTFDAEVVALDMGKKPAWTNESQEIVKKSISAARKVLLREPGITGLGCGTDMTYFSIDAGIPTIIFGPGDIARAHAVDEYVPVSEVIEATMFYVMLCIEYLTA